MDFAAHNYNLGKNFFTKTISAPTTYPWMKPQINPMMAPKNVAAYPLYNEANNKTIGSPTPRAIAAIAKVKAVTPKMIPNLAP